MMMSTIASLLLTSPSTLLTLTVLLPLHVVPAPIAHNNNNNNNSKKLPKLLLISFDGFGYDYLNKLPPSELPGFQRFISTGVHVKWVENVFPTVTRPMHMTMVTGLYPESHGIVENKFYDPQLRGYMPREGKVKANDSRWMDVGAEPIWVTNSKAGRGRRSGSVYFPCADARIRGHAPEEIRRGEWSVKEKKFSGVQRVDLALDWLTGTGVKPVNFVAMYTQEPDAVTHKYGPHSQELLEEIRARDRIVGHLMSEIKRRGVEELNVIITSDHGQLPLFLDHTINIDELVDPDWYEALPPFGNKAMTSLWPKKGCYEKIVNGLRGKHPHLHVATKEERADLVWMHYSASPRISPIVIYADPGWIIINSRHLLYMKGQHGWDPTSSPRLWPFFLARGPAFKKGLRDADPFSILDVYPLMCRVLGLTPAPNNGSLGNAAHVLNLAAGETAPLPYNNYRARQSPGDDLPHQVQLDVLPSSLFYNFSEKDEANFNFTWVAAGLFGVVLVATLSRCQACRRLYHAARHHIPQKRYFDGLPR